ncbi:MAG: hypothetical protein M0Z65_06585 [Firmicutes bacterium]|uniref:Uncharacterized protein n=1 Tax=Melghirimyces thermohalophilus TaxID=1236220 RepID=A0A1G6IEH8_9BACL|nr:hypothetical protein [Melghirimyces thermohalophilus]MDA8352847.1 hypothetical protein [Bacillota bacterium]SDC04952.1 hypothetical protein SAMN04488112_102201 [Melghirimyces thermohalophilus]
MKKLWVILKAKFLALLIITIIQYFLLLWLYSISPHSHEASLLAFSFVLITAFIVLIYGVPISVLSDYLTQKKYLRWLWAFLIHSTGGALLPALLWFDDIKEGRYLWVLWGLISAFLFWLIDELLKMFRKI